MSAITKIFGAIISFITGLIGGVVGILFKKKKGEFYLEIDPSKPSAAAAAPAVAAPEKTQTAPSKPAKKAKNAKAAKKSKSAPAPQTAAAPATAAPAQAAPTPVMDAAAIINQALNMPKPQVGAGQANAIQPLDIPKFGPRRRPGSNMQSFLDMARTVKS